MFVELTRKDNSQPVAIRTDSVDTFNVDADGSGTILILRGGHIRVVAEDYKLIKALMGFQTMTVAEAQAPAPAKKAKAKA